MAAITLEWDSRDLQVWRGAKVDKALAKALKKAGSSAIRDMKRKSAQVVRSKKRFKLSKVNNALDLTYPQGDDIGALVWTMDVSSEATPVSAFRVTQTKAGVRVAINTGSAVTIKSAFIVRLKSGHIGVFMRDGKGRLPIHELYTSTIANVFNNAETVPAAFAAAEVSFHSAFARLLPLELGKLH